MKAADLERLIASVSKGRVRTDAAQRMRVLRNLGLIPSGGRGPNAPEIGPEHCASFVIAVGGATVASEAGRAVLNFAPLIPHDPMWGGTLREVLVRAFEEPEIGRRIKELRFLHEEIEVQMMWRDEEGELHHTFFRPEDGSDVMDHDRGAIGDETFISGKVIAEIIADLHGTRPPLPLPATEDEESLGDILGEALKSGKAK
jgi:hypothetical protein